MKNTTHFIKKVRFYPSIPTEWTRGTYMPVSMNNRLMQSEDSVKEILFWVFKHTNTIEAIIGDYLHRHNIMMNGLDEESAIQESLAVGKKVISVLELLRNQFPEKKLIIRPVREFYEHISFENRLAYFRECYERNEQFQEEINFLIHQFLERQGHIEGSMQQIECCKNYLLEELVIFELLAIEKKRISVYPGKQLRVLKRIVTGQLPNISDLLSTLTLAEMKFSPSAGSWIKEKI